jgi:hypothetical protein
MLTVTQHMRQKVNMRQSVLHNEGRRTLRPRARVRARPRSSLHYPGSCSGLRSTHTQRCSPLPLQPSSAAALLGGSERPVRSGMKQSPSRAVRYICVQPRLYASNLWACAAATRALLGGARPNPSSHRLPAYRIL